MTIVRHRCLADGSHRLGSCLDCPKCRDALIKSFGEPVPEFQEPENSMERSPEITEQHDEDGA